MKKRFGFGLVLLAMSFNLGLSAQSARRNDPFSGAWKLNTIKSTTVVPTPTAVRIKADNKTISFSEQEADGGTTTAEAKFDGKDYPVRGSSVADAAAYRRVGPRTIKSTVKQRGQILLTETMTVSDDGKTLTVGFTQFSGTAVFDKQ